MRGCAGCRRIARLRLAIVIIVALLIVAIGFVVVRFYERAEGAVSQVDRLYACVTPHGGPARVWAYTPPCRGGQVVTWEVSGG